MDDSGGVIEAEQAGPALAEPVDTRPLGERLFVEAENLAATDLNAPIAELTRCDCHAMETAFIAAAKQAEAEGRSDDHRAYTLISVLCSITLTPEDKAEPWRARITWADGNRSAIPSDFQGTQSQGLESVVTQIAYPALRARLADLVWSNDFKRGAAAAVAVEAYCECAEGLLTGRFQAAYEKDTRATFELVSTVHRALQLAYATGKKVSRRCQLPDRVKAAWRGLYELAVKDAAFVVFMRAAEVGLHFELVEPAEVAGDAEIVVAKATAGQYTMAVQGVWDFAAHLYDQLGDKDARRRCQIGSLGQVLTMRKQVTGAGAEAYWVGQALQALRHIDGMEELEEELEGELRRLQKASLKEMKPFSVKIDVGEQRARTIEQFEALGLPAALYQFAFLTDSSTREELRAEALEGLKRSPLSSLFGGVHLDEHGKPISATPGASLGEEPDEGWFLQEINRREGMSRIYIVGGAIDPARGITAARFNLGEHHFRTILQHCPFVPSSQDAIVALGFTRLFQGDFMSAVHLLIPQMEPCLRNILRLAGHDPVKRFDDGTEEEMDLGNMLDRRRDGLEKIFGDPIVYEIERLFHARPGPALRHELAHGLISAGGCYHADAIYACWFLYRLCVLFVAERWDEAIAPELELLA